MPEKKAPKRERRVIAPDSDKLGHVAGAAIATVVMALCFFYQEVSLPATLVRAGWAFVFSYAVTFILVRIVLHTALSEMVKDKKNKAQSEAEPPEEESARES